MPGLGKTWSGCQARPHLPDKPKNVAGTIRSEGNYRPCWGHTLRRSFGRDPQVSGGPRTMRDRLGDGSENLPTQQVHALMKARKGGNFAIGRSVKVAAGDMPITCAIILGGTSLECWGTRRIWFGPRALTAGSPNPTIVEVHFVRGSCSYQPADYFSCAVLDDGGYQSGWGSNVDLGSLEIEPLNYLRCPHLCGKPCPGSAPSESNIVAGVENHASCAAHSTKAYGSPLGSCYLPRHHARA